MEYKTKLDCKLTYHTFQGVLTVMPILLRNMLQDKSKPIHVYYDTDIDGVLAGELARRFVAYVLHMPYKILINTNREHGFKKDLKTYANTNIIGVDFGVDSNKMKEITEAGCNFLILDHHDCEEDVILFVKGKKLNFKEVIKDKQKLKELQNTQGVGLLINNQYPAKYDDNKKRISGENPKSKYLSGAGVVFESFRKFIEKYMPAKLSNWDTKEQRAMVGWSLLSDVRDIESDSAHAYLQDLYTYNPKNDRGTTQPNHDLMNSLIRTLDTVNDKNARGWNRTIGRTMLDRKNMDFSLSPLMNANFRFDNGDAVVKYMMGNPTDLDLGMHQAQKDLVKLLDQLADKKYYGKDKNLCTFAIDLNHPDLVKYKNILTNFVGLLCNKYKDGCSVIGYSMDNGVMKRASFRGNVQGACYKEELNSRNLLVGAGHEGAFGILELNPTDEVFDKIAEVCASIEDKEEKQHFEVISVDNLARFGNKNDYRYREADGLSKGYHVAFENMYHLDEYKTRLRYSSTRYNTISGEWNQAKTACTYTVDGVEVLCFNYPLTPKDGLILPTLEDGVLKYYLDMKDIDTKPVKKETPKPAIKSIPRTRSQIIQYDDMDDYFDDEEYY